MGSRGSARRGWCGSSRPRPSGPGSRCCGGRAIRARSATRTGRGRRRWRPCWSAARRRTGPRAATRSRWPGDWPAARRTPRTSGAGSSRRSSACLEAIEPATGRGARRPAVGGTRARSSCSCTSATARAPGAARSSCTAATELDGFSARRAASWRRSGAGSECVYLFPWEAAVARTRPTVLVERAADHRGPSPDVMAAISRRVRRRQPVLRPKARPRTCTGADGDPSAPGHGGRRRTVRRAIGLRLGQSSRRRAQEIAASWRRCSDAGFGFREPGGRSASFGEDVPARLPRRGARRRASCARSTAAATTSAQGARPPRRSMRGSRRAAGRELHRRLAEAARAPASSPSWPARSRRSVPGVRRALPGASAGPTVRHRRPPERAERGGRAEPRPPHTSSSPSSCCRARPPAGAARGSPASSRWRWRPERAAGRGDADAQRRRSTDLERLGAAGEGGGRARCTGCSPLVLDWLGRPVSLAAADRPRPWRRSGAHADIAWARLRLLERPVDTVSVGPVRVARFEGAWTRTRCGSSREPWLRGRRGPGRRGGRRSGRSRRRFEAYMAPRAPLA